MIHNTCNMAIRDLPDMYTLSPGPAALGLRHTYQANPSWPCYNYYMYYTNILETIIFDNLLSLQSLFNSY